jgi:desulfoferrodoxin-like iron-binding protein
MITFVCSVCEHIEFTTVSIPCPVCKSPAEKSTCNDRIFEESAERSIDAAIKHTPVITVKKKGGLYPEQSCLDITVRIGANLHPMENTHFIQFIDCYVDENYVSRVALTSRVYAAGCFHLKLQGTKVTVVENCNIHGYWKTDVIL